MNGRILVAGASGFIGSRIVTGLLDAGLPVACCGRSPARLARRFPGTTVLPCDLRRDSEDDWARRLDGVETVVNSAGVFRGDMEGVHARGPARLFDACRAAGVRRVIHISALGVGRGVETRFFATKLAGERALAEAAARGGGLDWCVIRPSLVIGRGGASTALFAALAALPVRPRLAGAVGPVQPLHVDDLAEAVARLVQAPAPLPRVVEAVGPGAMSVDELVETLGSWLGMCRRLAAAVPAGLLTAAARASDRVAAAPLNSEALAMLKAGNTGDASGIAALLGRSPRPLTEALARHPATESDRLQARLYFLRAPLRLSLAFLWLATGAVSMGLYPVEGSLAMLAGVGLTGPPALAALYGAALLDLCLGAALLIAWRPVLVGALQLALMAAFTLIAAALPAEYWLHPFAPLLKNVPVAAATAVMMALEA